MTSCRFRGVGSGGRAMSHC